MMSAHTRYLCTLAVTGGLVAAPGSAFAGTCAGDTAVAIVNPRVPVVTPT